MKLDGKPFDPYLPPPAVDKIAHILDRLPHDEVFTLENLARKAGMAITTLRHWATHPKLDSYRVGSRGAKLIWGHPKAIVEYKKLTGAK